MITRWLLNNFRTLVDWAILLVVAGLVVWWNPFGWRFDGPKLKGTPVSIKSIRAIGQLVTAEYYGEVVQSSADIFTVSKDSLLKLMELSYNDIRAIINEIETKPEYDARGPFKKEARLNILRYQFPEVYGSRQCRDIMMLTGREEEKFALEYIRDNSWGTFLAKRYNNYYSNEAIKQEVVYVGRGWVKAGIDIQNFGVDNFSYSADSQRITIKGIVPEIFDADINPWFVPELKIKGFEILRSRGQRIRPQMVSRVKEQCKQKLVEDALVRGVLLKAKQNAEESLLHLFTLLLDKQILHLTIDVAKYDLILKGVLYDNFIGRAETEYLYDMAVRDMAVPDAEWYSSFDKQKAELKAMITRLHDTKVETEDQAKWQKILRLAGVTPE